MFGIKRPGLVTVVLVTTAILIVLGVFLFAAAWFLPNR